MPSINKWRSSRSKAFASVNDIDDELNTTKLECEHRQEESSSCRDEKDVFSQEMAFTTADMVHKHKITNTACLESPYNTERSLIDDKPSDDSQSVVESEADTFVINNLTCRLLSKESFKIDEIAIPCTCFGEQVSSGSSSEQIKSVEYLGSYNAESALSRAREILANAKHLQKMIETGFCNSFCSSYECIEYEYWTRSSEEQSDNASTLKTDDSNIILQNISREQSNNNKVLNA